MDELSLQQAQGHRILGYEIRSSRSPPKCECGDIGDINTVRKRLLG
jgi:hypothetical protein